MKLIQITTTALLALVLSTTANAKAVKSDSNNIRGSVAVLPLHAVTAEEVVTSSAAEVRDPEIDQLDVSDPKEEKIVNVSDINETADNAPAKDSEKAIPEDENLTVGEVKEKVSNANNVKESGDIEYETQQFGPVNFNSGPFSGNNGNIYDSLQHL